ncbi:response regulator [Sandaracinus amylolyticus]|uniref:response regulator n=1 Tax=Sandaracinus amylolyticus TaxID=927083 RepID=UPI001F3D1200|nr:response regulator [Sandaracinus amylolyticus]UJR82313.1 Hypothetical protein I5071_43780 [Sandaracinus amylolyticus]
MNSPSKRAAPLTRSGDDRPTVLLVGGGERMQEALASALERHAVAVEQASTPSAVDAVFVGAPDLVMLLGDAADDDGSAVLARLAANVATAVVPVAILGGDAALDRRLQAFRFGAVAVVERSASVDAMARRIAELAHELPERSGETAGELGEASLDEVVELFSRRLRSGILAVTTPGTEEGARIVLRGDRPVTEAIEEFVQRIRPLVSRAEPLVWEFQESPTGKLRQLDLGEPSGEIDLGAVFGDRRIVLVERSPARADDLVQSLRQRGAHVVVIDGEGTNVAKARSIDPDVVVVDVDGVGGWAASTMRTIRRDTRLRWASLLVVRAQELWPDSAPEPDVMRLASGLRPLIEADDAIERRARDAKTPFELRMETTGPARMLRALARTQRTLHLSVRHRRAQIAIDLAEGLLVGASAKLEGATPSAEKTEVLGSTALAALLALGSGRVRVEPRTAPSLANLMAPVDAAIAAADREAPPLRPSLPPASMPPPASGPGAVRPPLGITVPRPPGAPALHVPLPAAAPAAVARSSDPRELVQQLESLLDKLRATLPIDATAGTRAPAPAAPPAASTAAPAPAPVPPSPAPASIAAPAPAPIAAPPSADASSGSIAPRARTVANAPAPGFTRAKKKTIVGLAPPSSPPPAPEPAAPVAASPRPPIPLDEILGEEPTREVAPLEINALAAAARAGLAPVDPRHVPEPLPASRAQPKSALPAPKLSVTELAAVPSPTRAVPPPPMTEPEALASSELAPLASSELAAPAERPSTAPSAPPERSVELDPSFDLDMALAQLPSVPPSAGAEPIELAPQPTSAAPPHSPLASAAPSLAPAPAVTAIPTPAEETTLMPVRRKRAPSILLAPLALVIVLAMVSAGAYVAYARGVFGPTAEATQQLPVVTARPAELAGVRPSAAAGAVAPTTAVAPVTPEPEAELEAEITPPPAEPEAPAVVELEPEEAEPEPELEAEPEAEAEPEGEQRSPTDQLIARANFRRNNGELQAAEADYLRVLRTDPRNARAIAGLVRLHMARRDARAATQWARRLVAARPNLPANHVLLGDALLLGGDRDGARRAWQRALEISPGFRDARRRLGQ